jgi:hypothetical protein
LLGRSKKCFGNSNYKNVSKIATVIIFFTTFWRSGKIFLETIKKLKGKKELNNKKVIKCHWKKFLELKRGDADGGGENKNASLKEKKCFAEGWLKFVRKFQLFC